ncbi:hypothetical protein GWI34_23245 [Actinomadura sp. DSM 109109]|nr:hypothetical protein [Actinomadura lepetitiana]
MTDDRDAAMRHVHRTLLTLEPGSRGTVQQVALEPLGRSRYVCLRTVAEAWVDARTAAVLWRDG